MNQTKIHLRFILKMQRFAATQTVDLGPPLPTPRPRRAATSQLVVILCLVSLVQVLYQLQGGLSPSQWHITDEVCDAFLLSVQRFQFPDFDGLDQKRLVAQLRRWLALVRPLLPIMTMRTGADVRADWAAIAATYPKLFQRARVWQVLVEVRRWLSE